MGKSRDSKLDCLTQKTMPLGGTIRVSPLGVLLLVALVRWLRAAPRVATPSLSPRRARWLRVALLLFPVVASLTLALLRAQDQQGVSLVREVASALAIGVVSFGFLGALGVALFLRLRDPAGRLSP